MELRPVLVELEAMPEAQGCQLSKRFLAATTRLKLVDLGYTYLGVLLGKGSFISMPARRAVAQASPSMKTPCALIRRKKALAQLTQ